MSEQITINQPRTGMRFPELGEVMRSRELLYFLTWRDVKVRYKQTLIGIGWAVLQPALTMVIFTIVFGRLAKVGSEDVPYSIFAYAALVPWTFLANAVTQSGQSLVMSERLLTKVWFPRLVIPLAAVGGVLVDLALSSVLLVVLLVVFGITPGLAVLTLPAFVLLALVTAAGVGSFLAAINVRYRDVRYVLPFLVQAWLFITPVAYSSELVPDRWRMLYALNPMVGVVDGYRWAVLGTDAPDLTLLVSVASAFALLAIGLAVFGRLEDTFADEV